MDNPFFIGPQDEFKNSSTHYSQNKRELSKECNSHLRLFPWRSLFPVIGASLIILGTAVSVYPNSCDLYKYYTESCARANLTFFLFT